MRQTSGAEAGEIDVLLVPADPSDAAGWRRLRDPQQFSRVFRAAEGRTSQEFRQLHSGA